MEPISTRQFLTNLRIVNLLHIDSKTGVLYENSWRQFQNSNFVSLRITGFIFLFLGCRQCNVIRYSVVYKISAKKSRSDRNSRKCLFFSFLRTPCKSSKFKFESDFFYAFKNWLKQMTPQQWFSYNIQRIWNFNNQNKYSRLLLFLSIKIKTLHKKLLKVNSYMSAYETNLFEHKN